MRRTAPALAAGLLALGLVACTSDPADPAPGAGASGGPTASTSSLTGRITVLAASSLTESFTVIGKRFRAANPGVTVTFSFAGSSALAAQATSGAPADVFASAGASSMDAVVAAGAAVDPQTFAVNVMEIAVPPSNPGKVTGLGSLASAGVKTALCQPQVPCGATAEKVFANAGLTVQPVTLEPDVKSVLGKVQLDEVDAGLVYVTDVHASGDKVRGIAIPDDVNASTSYPIAALEQSADPRVAAAFVAYVLSPDAQAVLTAAGFRSP